LLLLDTCTFLWWVAGDPSVPAVVRDRLRDPDEQVFLSVVSTWEVCLKFSLGKLPLPAPPADYLPDRRVRHGIASVDLQETDVLAVTKLPVLHRDPFDRMLVAQAIARGFVLVTPDPLVRAYPCVTWWG
jgi:PIN domain nuclease of toxin-antitoxin system